MKCLVRARQRTLARPVCSDQGGRAPADDDAAEDWTFSPLRSSLYVLSKRMTEGKIKKKKFACFEAKTSSVFTPQDQMWRLSFLFYPMTPVLLCSLSLKKVSFVTRPGCCCSSTVGHGSLPSELKSSTEATWRVKTFFSINKLGGIYLVPGWLLLFIAY